MPFPQTKACFRFMLVASLANCGRNGTCAARSDTIQSIPNVPDGASIVTSTKDGRRAILCLPTSSPEFFDCTVYNSYGQLINRRPLWLQGGATAPFVYEACLGDDILLKDGRVMHVVEPPKPRSVPSDAVWINQGCGLFVAQERDGLDSIGVNIFDDIDGTLIFSSHVQRAIDPRQDVIGGCTFPPDGGRYDLALRSRGPEP
jgi:hypothetical protein